MSTLIPAIAALPIYSAGGSADELRHRRLTTHARLPSFLRALSTTEEEIKLISWSPRHTTDRAAATIIVLLASLNGGRIPMSRGLVIVGLPHGNPALFIHPMNQHTLRWARRNGLLGTRVHSMRGGIRAVFDVVGIPRVGELIILRSSETSKA